MAKVKPTLMYLLRRQLVVLWVAISLMGLYLFLFAWGPYLETKYWPMAEDFEIVAYHNDEDANRVDMKMTFNKIRGCEYMGMSWYSGTPLTEARRVRIEFSDRFVGNTISRPVGKQVTGWWHVYIPEDMRGQPMFGVTDHDCGMPWTSHTVIGPFYDWYNVSDEVNPADAIGIHAKETVKEAVKNDS